MMGALGAALRFVRRNLGAAVGLYLMNLVLFLLAIAAYAAFAPGASASWLAFFAAQVYIVLRVVVRLQFAASQTALFQGRLAHTGYVAAPAPAWPDSPAAEAMAAASLRDAPESSQFNAQSSKETRKLGEDGTVLNLEP
jgi:hypothetical protein